MVSMTSEDPIQHPVTSTHEISFQVSINSPAVHHGTNWYASRYTWIVILSIILLLTVIHLINLIRHRYYHTTSPSKGKLHKATRVIETAARNWAYLRSFPSWLYGPETYMEAIWSGGYCLMMLAYAFWKTNLGDESWESAYLANRLGVLAYSQVPLIIILIQKNNPISALTGITYQKLNYLHRASSRVCLLFSWLHFVLWIPDVWEAGHFSHWYIIWGLTALFGFTFLWLTSIRWIRRVAFEFFLISHIIFTLMFIIGGIFHWQRLSYWLWPSLIIWFLDRAIRYSRALMINPPWSRVKHTANSKIVDERKAGECVIELISPEVMRLTARRPGLRWTAGHHFFLSAPSISASRLESHPFSVANVPNEREEVVFIIRVHNGFTKLLRNSLQGEITNGIPVYLEGPYGSAHSLTPYATVLLVAGGTGVTFCFSHLLSLLRPPATHPQHIHLIWHIRHTADISWLSPLLNEAAALASNLPQITVTIDVHVTKSHASDEPAPPEGWTERLVENLGLESQPSFEREHSTLSTGVASTPIEGIVGEEEGRPLLWRPRLSVTSDLTRDAERLIHWNKGRASMSDVIERDLSGCLGTMNVTVCGPVQLMQATRDAIRDFTTITRVWEGQAQLNYYEETLGA